VYAKDAGLDVGRPLLLTADPGLLDDVVQLAGGVGRHLEVIAEAGAARSQWAQAPLVLVGLDLAAEVVRRRLPRRGDVVLVWHDMDEPAVWEAAVSVGAEHVAILPDAEDWLAGRIEGLLRPAVTAPVVCVIGGRGGAGASTLATALALVTVRRGQRCMLIDADPLGGGLDQMLTDSSARFGPSGAAGSVGGAALSLLSWNHDDALQVPAEAMRVALEVGRRDSDLVVVDLPRRLDPAAGLALACGGPVLLVVPAQVRAAAAAVRVATAVERSGPAVDLRVVVRGPTSAGLSPEAVAAGLGLPLAGFVRADRRAGCSGWTRFGARFLDCLDRVEIRGAR
jgi:secretion/DNA translocation related CpaE-like protein